MDIRVYWIWLQGVLGIGGADAAAVLEHYARPEEVYALEGEAAARVCVERKLSDHTRGRLADKDLTLAQKALADTLRMGGWVLTPGDAAYPPLLRGIFAPPVVLYGRGDVPHFERQPAITVVGTREADMAGVATAAAIGAGLVAGGALLVSGSAPGVDAAALDGALRRTQGGGIVSVQACGLDNDYPSATWKLRQAVLDCGGALLSEYPPGTEALASNFRVRNRLLAGLSLGTCVINAPEKSGALITANWAREQGRDVFAVPGDVLSGRHDGVNHLIQEGARLVARPGEILREYVFRFGETVSPAAADAAYAQELARRRRESHAQNPARWDEVEVSVDADKPKKTRKSALPKASTSAETASAPMPCPDGVSDAAARVYAALGEEPRAADEIAAAAGLPVGEALAALTELELFGCVQSGAGQRYRAMNN